MALKPSHLYVLFLFLIIQLKLANSRTLKSNVQSFKSLKSLEGSEKGQTTKGLNELKNYLKTFGYYPNHLVANNLAEDHFDDSLESAIKAYQRNYHLNVTGILDSDTVENMMIPRCGVADPVYHPSKPGNKTEHDKKSGKFHQVSHYSFGNQMTRWPPSKTQLTYSFLSHVQVPAISLAMLKSACSRAFQRWADVSAFSFQEASNNAMGDIVIGFERGDHGDSIPFNDLSVLAHSFFPTDGRSHYNADESWSTTPSTNEFDLESVLVHEIGHLLGLGHSMDRNAIMFPSIPPGTVKRDLTQDDIDGIQALYPN